ncbi:MAG: asparagine synthase (glutamine-hydrolyzing) [Bryobacteraceae bacterium]
MGRQALCFCVGNQGAVGAPRHSRKFEASLLPEYLAFGYTSEERTLYSGIRTLMPGHWLELDVSGLEPRLNIQRYWDPPQPGSIEYGSDEEWIRECRRRLEETVHMRLMSDVPLGMFLSGGVDSSAIAAMVARMNPGTLNTFSVGYAEAAYSELPWAAQAAKAIGAEHREVQVSRQEFFEVLPRLIWHEDEPITWPSSVSLYFVSRLAAQHVKVVLTGEGSDELFGGYHRYQTYLLNHKAMQAYRFVPGFLRSFIRDRIADSSLLSATMRRKLGHTVLGREGTYASLYVENFLSAFTRAEQASLLRRDNNGSVLDNYLKYWNASEPGRSPLARLLYTDQKTYLVELLMKQDQMSMACSIESRVPFLDHEFVEFAANIPDRLKIRDGSGKWIFKKAVEDLLPHDITYRRKMGFPTPLRKWLLDAQTQPMLDRMVADGSFCCEYLERSAITRLLDRHRRGVEDGTDRIWRLLNLELWGSQCFAGGESRLTYPRGVEDLLKLLRHAVPGIAVRNHLPRLARESLTLPG